jgi:hypothetical protein
MLRKSLAAALLPISLLGSPPLQAAILIGGAAIKNPCMPLKLHAMFSSNRLRIACLHARFSHALHSTNRHQHRTTRAFLIATRVLEIRLICSQQKRKLFLIATFFALSRMLGTAPLASLDSPAALTTPHPSPTMKSVPCMLQRIVRCVATVADHGSLIMNHQSRNMGQLHV